jgi:hypothetical protein
LKCVLISQNITCIENTLERREFWFCRCMMMMHPRDYVHNNSLHLLVFPSDQYHKTTRRTLARGIHADNAFPAEAAHLWCTRSQYRRHSHRFHQRTCLNPTLENWNNNALYKVLRLRTNYYNFGPYCTHLSFAP